MIFSLTRTPKKPQLASEFFCSIRSRKPFERAVDLSCRIGNTNHPEARNYKGLDCTVVAIRVMTGGQPMLTVQFPNGVQIQGLFFSELEDTTGEPLKQQAFR